jgi:diguanylate cyclase (GGDEF)-like protein
MSAAIAGRRALLLAGVTVQVTTLALFIRFEIPGLGLGHLYYLAVALYALAAGMRAGILAGMSSTMLYALGVVLNPTVPTNELLSASTGIRLITYTTVGVLVGWFADHDRHLVERLRVLAERDFLTGLPNTRAFEAAISRRLAAGRPFALLLGDMDRLKAINDEFGHTEGNDALRRLAGMLGNALRPGDDVARVGGDEFAVLTPVPTSEAAAQLAARLERLLADQHTATTFGWAVYPSDGENALSLYRAADERLYARKLFHGRRRRSPTLVGLSS